MKIFIPSHNRHDIITAHRIFKDSPFDYKIVLHNEEQRNNYIQNKEIDPTRIVVADIPEGMSNMRQWIRDNLVQEGEWYANIDDNITKFTAVEGSHYDLNDIEVPTQKMYSAEVDWYRLQNLFSELSNKADVTGAKYCGFATTDNYYFRTKKWRDVGYVIGKTFIAKKDSRIKYDLKIQAMDDYAFTAENLKVFGRVLINNFVFAHKKHYAKGGVGTYDERLPKKLHDCEYMMTKYPNLFRYKVKKDCHPKAELQIRFSNLDQVKAWNETNKSTLKSFF